MSILRRYLWCHYCTQKTPNTQSGVVRKFTCQNCGAVNYLDERGEITDPPAEATGFTSNFHYARPVPRATSPELAGPPEQDSLFCRECLKNQQLVATALAEYLPSPDDPEYTKYEATVDAYKNDLEQRYPQVCADCIPRVRSRIRAAGYAAKTDHLRRVLEKTRNGGALYGRSSWNWRNIVLLLAGWIYVASVIFGLLWHTFGALMRPEDVLNDESQCAYQAWNRGQVEPQCFDHMWVYAQIGLLCGLLSFWWNPKLQQKASGSSGRLKGLRSHMTLQAVLLAARILSMYYLAEVPSTFQNALDIFRAGHAFMGFFVLLITVISLHLVRLDHTPLFSFNDTIEPHLPSPPPNHPSNRPSSRSNHKPILTSFDTMAASFSENFPIGKLGESSNYLPENVQYQPPSPTTSTYMSESAFDDDSQTTVSDSRDNYNVFHARRSNEYGNEDSMDWTPTRQPAFAGRFQGQPIQLNGLRRGQQLQNNASTQHQHVQFLAQQYTPSPFTGMLPPAPKPPAHKLNNPFSKPTGLVQKVPDSQKAQFFSNMMFSQGSAEAKNALRPSNAVQEGKEFVLEKPKMEWREEQQETGLEGIFDRVFALKDEGDTPQASPVKSRKETAQTASGQTVIVGDIPPARFSMFGQVGQMLLVGCLPVGVGMAIVWWKGWY